MEGLSAGDDLLTALIVDVYRLHIFAQAGGIVSHVGTKTLRRRSPASFNITTREPTPVRPIASL
jgi:hypothetical protein